MKKFILVTVLAAFAFFANAQEPLFVKGDKLVNIGLGLGYYTSISASLDYCIADGIAEKGSIGVGPYVGIGRYFGWGYGWGYSSGYTAFMGGARGTFHYPFIEKLDTYGGLAMGLNLYNYSGFGIHPDFGFFVGANYPLTEKIIVFGELGAGVSYLSAGISFKL